jgi:hypothetical protein
MFCCTNARGLWVWVWVLLHTHPLSVRQSTRQGYALCLRAHIRLLHRRRPGLAVDEVFWLLLLAMAVVLWTIQYGKHVLWLACPVATSCSTTHGTAQPAQLAGISTHHGTYLGVVGSCVHLQCPSEGTEKHSCSKVRQPRVLDKDMMVLCCGLRACASSFFLQLIALGQGGRWDVGVFQGRIGVLGVRSAWKATDGLRNA